MKKSFHVLGIISLSIIFLFLVTTNVSASYCYQESANTSNQGGLDGECGLNYTGSYTNISIWSNPSLVYDGDWSTGTNRGASNGISYFNITYAKPINSANTSIWKVSNATSDGTTNVSIPISCWTYNSSYLFFSTKIVHSPGNDVISWYCQNTTNQVDVGVVSYYATDKFYEEAMIWNITENIRINITGLSPANNTYSSSNDVLFNASSITIVSTNHSWCYQESANQTTAGNGNCALTYNGLYYSSKNQSNLWYDEDWSTGVKGTGAGGEVGYYINYSKPDRTIVNSTWQTKYGTSYVNNSITSSCLSQSTLQLKIDGDRDGILTYCWSGSAWTSINNLCASNCANLVYEEAMMWDVTNGVTSNNVSLILSYTNGTTAYQNTTTIFSFVGIWLNNLLDGKYLWNLFANANDSSTIFTNNSLNNYTITIDTIQPSINFSSETPTNNTNFSRSWIVMNSSASDVTAGLYSLTNYIYNSAYGLESSHISPSTCYQESANISSISDSDCTFNFTGNYAITTGTVSNFTNATALYDENYSTSSSAQCLGAFGCVGNASIMINYSKPTGATPSTEWRVKGGSSPYDLNYSIPLSCFNQERLQFRLTSLNNANDKYTYGDCFNGTSYTSVFNRFSVSNLDGANIYEEGIVWNLSLNSINNYYNFTSLSDGLYYINSTAIDLAGNINSTATRKVILDLSPPNISILLPIAGATYSTNSSMIVNLSVNDVLQSVSACWFSVINSTGSIFANNVSVPSCQNATFQVTGNDMTYNLTIYSNDSLNNLNSTVIQFGITTNSPAIVKNAPIDTSYLNYHNVSFNYTATSSNGLSVCSLYGNFSDTYALNYSWVNPTNATMNYTYLNLPDKRYVWDVWCNSTTNSLGKGISNYTVVVDTTNPVMNDLSITTTANSNQITFLTNITDLNLGTCLYNIFTGSTPGTNTSFTCNSNTLANAPAFGTYNLYIYVTDLAGNFNQQNLSFTTSISSGSTSSGGGVVTGDTEWTMRTDSRGSNYILEMSPGTQRSKSIQFTNKGSNKVDLTLNVDGNAVGFITLDKKQLTLPLLGDIPTYLDFKVSIPKGTPYGAYQSNIIATDSSGNSGFISVTVKVGSLGFFTKLSTSKQVGSIFIPYWIISFLTGSLVGFLVFFGSKRSIPDLAMSVSIISGLIGFFAILFFV